ncbi:hypothetical protein BDW67DRAFT_185753 [Aspergillus spinulosporus]
MRFQLKYMAILAVFLGLLLQTTARAVPNVDKDARAVVPKPPGKTTTNSDGAQNNGPKASNNNSNSNNSNNSGHDTKTNSYIPSKSGESAGSTVCKHAECNTDLEVPEYDFTKLKRSDDKETVSGVVEWDLPVSAVRAPADKKTFRQNLRKFAEGIYKTLMDEPKGKVIDKKGYNLVAVLFVPKEGIFLSTIPRKSGAKAMEADWKTKAPRLEYATDGRRNGDEKHPNKFHAEDGAIYTYEKESGSRSLDDIGLKFPTGTEILVYGKRDHHDKDPKVVPPCSPDNPLPGEIVRNPSCIEVLYELNIKSITKEEAA